MGTSFATGSRSARGKMTKTLRKSLRKFAIAIPLLA
ncbi:aspartyl/asparaginyl beta-hydroxylase domain-containing protein, partial [Mesorhizobium sp. M7A.F.Ca.CA.004.02.1.1]